MVIWYASVDGSWYYWHSLKRLEVKIVNDYLTHALQVYFQGLEQIPLKRWNRERDKDFWIKESYGSKLDAIFKSNKEKYLLCSE